MWVTHQWRSRWKNTGRQVAVAPVADDEDDGRVADLLRDRFLTLIANGGEHLDWSAIATLSAGVTSDDPA